MSEEEKPKTIFDKIAEKLKQLFQPEDISQTKEPTIIDKSTYAKITQLFDLQSDKSGTLKSTTTSDESAIQAPISKQQAENPNRLFSPSSRKTSSPTTALTKKTLETEKPKKPEASKTPSKDPDISNN